MIPVLVVTALILLNALFVAAEFAIVGVSRAEIEPAARAGGRAAKLVRTVLADPLRQDRYIATAQLGITAASLGLGMYGEHVLAHWLQGHLEAFGTGGWIAAHAVSSVLAVAILTYFHIVIGEMVPKALALQRARETALWIAPLMRAVELAFYPFVLVLNGIGNGLLRLVGVERTVGGAEHYRTPEEIAYVVRESRSGGKLDPATAGVVSELLEFGDLMAEEVMVPRVRIAALEAGGSVEELRAILSERPHSRYPVHDGNLDRIVGAIHVKAILRTLEEGKPLAEAPVQPVPYVPATASVDHVLRAMREERSQLVVVMDEHGGTAGIITIEDLFEEVVGDVTDDPDEPPKIFTDARNRVHVPGTLRVEEAGEATGVVLEHDRVETVSGLILDELGRPPRPGDVIVYDDVRFEVVSVRGHGVEECIVTPLRPLDGDERPAV